MTVPVVRQRAKAPKTRTGCRTCRARHIKCDEDRPACQRCIRSNRECPGYDPVVTPRPRGTTSKLAFVQPKAISSTSSIASFLSSPREMTIDLSAVEMQLLDYFRLQTVHQLPGNSWTLSWEKLALHTSAHEPAVSHAAIALSSLHRGQQEVALDQCNKAMSYARSRIESLASGQQTSDTDIEVIIIVSLLLFCFEVWRAQDYRAALHLRTGQSILYERIRSRDGSPEGDDRRRVKMPVTPKTNMDLLLQTFVRLGSDLTLTRGSDVFLKPVVHERIPTCFSSLEEAMVHLDALTSAVYEAEWGLRKAAAQYLSTQARSVPPAKETLLPRFQPGIEDCLIGTYSKRVSLREYPELEGRLPVLRQDVCRFMSALACVPVQREQEAGHLLIQMQIFSLWFEVSSWREPNEMFCDRFEDQFEHIISQAERYVAMQTMGNVRSSSTEGSSFLQPAFSIGTSLVSCVAGIAMKCRKSSIRRRCIDLMREVDLQGVFDTAYMVSFTETMIDLEESCAREMLGFDEHTDLECHQVPVEARLLDIDMAARPEGLHALDSLGTLVHANTESLREESFSYYKQNIGRIVYACYGVDSEIELREKEFVVDRGTPRRAWSCELNEPSLLDCVDPVLLRSVTV